MPLLGYVSKFTVIKVTSSVFMIDTKRQIKSRGTELGGANIKGV